MYPAVLVTAVPSGAISTLVQPQRGCHFPPTECRQRGPCPGTLGRHISVAFSARPHPTPCCQQHLEQHQTVCCWLLRTMEEACVLYHLRPLTAEFAAFSSLHNCSSGVEGLHLPPLLPNGPREEHTGVYHNYIT